MIHRLEQFKRFDWTLLIVTILLVSFGLAAIYSVDLSQPEANFLNFQKQLFFFGLGLILFFLASWFDYKLLRHFNYIFYFLTVILLTAVLFWGQTVRGTTGWFSLQGINFQPVELAKLALIVFLSYYFSRRSRPKGQLRYVIISGLSALVLIGLVILQPDLGSASVLFLLWLIMLLAIGVKRRHFLIIVLLIATIFLISWFFVFEPYQRARIITFVNPTTDPLGEGYNITQSIIAIGSGQWLGRGLSFGSQSQLKFLPESQTDFIFAVLAEELGWLGVILIFSFWLLLFYRLLRAARLAADDFGSFLVIGILFLLVIQFFVNLGANLGLMPVTGISLSLMSYGGSGLVMALIMLGLVESVIVRGRRREI